MAIGLAHKLDTDIKKRGIRVFQAVSTQRYKLQVSELYILGSQLPEPATSTSSNRCLSQSWGCI